MAGEPRWASRFWAKVDKHGPMHPYDDSLGPCWVWTASRVSFGYGKFSVEHGNTQRAHRLSWALAHGDVPDHATGLVVRHSCDRAECVNPSHLLLGTARDNVLDALKRRRRAWGEMITHCPHGHPYSGDNLAIVKALDSTHRVCKTCRREGDRRRRPPKTRDAKR